LKSALIVASDRLDHIRLLAQRINIIPLRDIAKVGATAQFSIDEALLLSAVVPEAASARGRGRVADQRDRILPILNDLQLEGVAVAASNEICDMVAKRFKDRYIGVKRPVRTTIGSAIALWSGD
jgi:hypothetical protein